MTHMQLQMTKVIALMPTEILLQEVRYLVTMESLRYSRSITTTSNSKRLQNASSVEQQIKVACVNYHSVCVITHFHNRYSHSGKRSHQINATATSQATKTRGQSFKYIEATA